MSRVGTFPHPPVGRGSPPPSPNTPHLTFFPSATPPAPPRPPPTLQTHTQLTLLPPGTPRGAIRPAVARPACHSPRSVSVRVRPAGSFHASPEARTKVVASDSPPSLYFCNRTPLPFAISGSSASGKTRTLRLSPTTATESPTTLRQSAVLMPAPRVSTCLHARVWASTSSEGTTNPSPAVEATSSFSPDRKICKSTISESLGRSTISRTGSPIPRPPGRLTPTSV